MAPGLYLPKKVDLSWSNSARHSDHVVGLTDGPCFLPTPASLVKQPPGLVPRVHEQLHSAEIASTFPSSVEQSADWPADAAEATHGVSPHQILLAENMPKDESKYTQASFATRPFKPQQQQSKEKSKFFCSLRRSRAGSQSSSAKDVEGENRVCSSCAHSMVKHAKFCIFCGAGCI